MIIMFNDYLMEQEQQKYYIGTRIFRFKSLKEATIYKLSELLKWQDKYNIDDYDRCTLVSLNKFQVPINAEIRLSRRDIKNKLYINPLTKSTQGTLIEESGLDMNNNLTFLYVLKNRKSARQYHGFKYEINLRVLNNLTNQGKYSAKWDAYGSLKENFIEERQLEKTVTFFNGKKYVDFNWENIPEKYKKLNYWSIKSPGVKNSIDIGDFNRISNRDQDFNLVTHEVQEFIFAIGFHDNEKNIIEEYIVLIPNEIWKTYLPDIDNNKDEFIAMKHELKMFRLKGERTEESEIAWTQYMNKYKKLTSDSIIKLRFKRDSKGQLRIQSAISNLDFRKTILLLPHIKIV